MGNRAGQRNRPAIKAPHFAHQRKRRQRARMATCASANQDQPVDACLQLHGGYGYMLEYPIARAFVDMRVTRIFGGTSEVLRELIARKL